MTSEAGMISLQQMVEGVILEVHIITASLLPPVSPPDKGKGGSPSSPPLDQGSKVNPMDTSPEITAPNKQDSPQTPSPLAPYVPLVELYTQTGSTVRSHTFEIKKLNKTGLSLDVFMFWLPWTWSILGET